MGLNVFFFSSAVVTGALTSLHCPPAELSPSSGFLTALSPSAPSSGKVQPRREPRRTFQTASGRSLANPTRPPSNGASAPDGQHGVDLPDEVPQLVHDLLQLLVLLLELLQRETNGAIADHVKDSRQILIREGMIHFTWIINNSEPLPPP